MANSPDQLPPGPPGAPIIGHAAERFGDPLNFFQKTARDYGDVALFRIFKQPFYLVSHPIEIQRVLVQHASKLSKGIALQRAKKHLGNSVLVSEGAEHLRQRRLLAPAFHRQRIVRYGEMMVEHAQRLSSTWKPGATVDMYAEMHRVTLAIVAQTLFGANVEEDTKVVSAAVHTLMKTAMRSLLPLSNWIDALPLPSNRHRAQAAKELDELMYRVIGERRATREDRGDLLSMLLTAQTAEDGKQEALTDVEVRDQAMTLFIAGHETTANALTWSWYLLSQHPEVRAKLEAEIDAVLAGRAPGYEDVARLKYTEQVFSETMRLYPPAWVIGRRVQEPVEVGGYVVPKQAMILTSQYVVHRDPRWWTDPEQFRPERWTEEAEAARPKFAYFPFGGGSRICIGEGFAWAEGILVLATLVQRWSAVLAPGAKVEPWPAMTLRPRGEVPMVLTARG